MYTDPLGGLGWGRCQNSTFLEYGHQIKGNDTYSNLVANIVPADTPSTSGVGGGQTFSLNVVKLHITLKGMKRRAPCKQIFCHYIHPRPLGSGEMVIFLKVVMLHIKLKGKKCKQTSKQKL